eukprot:gene12461-8548_t
MTEKETAGEVLFVGALSACVIGYDVRDSSLANKLADRGGSISLAATVSAPYPRVRERLAAVADATAPPELISFETLRQKRQTAGRLRLQRATFVPVLLEALSSEAVDEREWREERQRDAGNATYHHGQAYDEEEKELPADEDAVGYLTLAAHLQLRLHLTRPNVGKDGAQHQTVSVPIASKNVRIRSLSHHSAHDMCSIVRVVVTGGTLEACCAAEMDDLAGVVPVEGRAALCCSVMLRVISVGHQLGALVDADAELAKLLGQTSVNPTAPTTPTSRFRLLTRERTPYGAVPLSELFRVYRLFCDTSYYCRPSAPRPATRAVLAADIWCATPELRAAEASFPHRWNALTDLGGSLDGRLLGEALLTPLLLTLSHCTNLRRLRLASNRLSDATCWRLCALFSHHRYLGQVLLPGNDIYESGADALLRLVRRNHRIIEVDVRDNPCSEAIRRRISKVAMMNETTLRQDPLHFFSSQYSFLVSPASLPRPVLREALSVWAQLTAAPLGDIDVWPRNSTTEDMDRYVDESVLPRLRDAEALADAPRSIIPLAAKAPLLSELMRTVSTAIQRVVPDPLVRSLFTDVAQMESGRQQPATVDSMGRSASAPASGGVGESDPSSDEQDTVPPELWTALQLQEESRQAGQLMEADELYSISFLRIIVTTMRTLEHQFDWEEVVDKLRKVGERQVALGVRMEDYWLAIHVFMKALQLSMEGGGGCVDSGMRPESISAVLATLALGFRTALLGAQPWPLRSIEPDTVIEEGKELKMVGRPLQTIERASKYSALLLHYDLKLYPPPPLHCYYYFSTLISFFFSFVFFAGEQINFSIIIFSLFIRTLLLSFPKDVFDYIYIYFFFCQNYRTRPKLEKQVKKRSSRIEHSIPIRPVDPAQRPETNRTMPAIYRLQVHEYVHVEDGNTGEVYTLLGPITFTLLDHLKPLHATPQPCVVVPPLHYVTVHNPVQRSGVNDPASTAGFQLICGPACTPSLLTHPTEVRCRHGEKEYRFAEASPFPLFPGEVAEAPEPMPLLQSNEALLLRVMDPFTIPAATAASDDDAAATERTYGLGEYRIFHGPGLYRPDTREAVVKRIQPIIVAPTEALWLKATQPFTEEVVVSENDDGAGRLVRVERQAGEEWTHSTPGMFFLHPHAVLVERLAQVLLSPSVAVLMEARNAFDDHGDGDGAPKRRPPGYRWLLTYDEVQAFTPTHEQKVVQRVSRVVVGPQQYCKVRHPLKNGKNLWGVIELRRGPSSFFLYPGEVLEDGTVWDAYVCAPDEALLVQALTAYTEEVPDATGTPVALRREPSQRWLVRGPCCYVPPLTVKVLEWRKVIPLSQHQGVYVQNMVTGNIRSVFGTPFLLSEEEALWEKPVSALVRRLLHKPWRTASNRPDSTGTAGYAAPPLLSCRSTVHVRGEHRTPSTSAKRFEGDLSVPDLDLRRFEVLTANVEENNFVRLYNASDGTSRVVAGPCTVYLSPHEEFTVMSLSGGRPKRPDQIHSLRLFLGPDYMADNVLVETLDHTRLQLSLAYNWEFDTSEMAVSMQKAFAIPDFVGEACRALASRVRAVIAGVTFENFHLHSTSIIRQAIFCQSGDGALLVPTEGQLYFSANGLVITNVDVQQVQPADDRTLHALKKSVQLAVEIITKSQENEATHQAALLEQEAAGALELQGMKDRGSTESQRLQVIEVESRNAEIELIGASTAHAVAQREARIVEVAATVDAAPLRCAAYEAAQDAELELLAQRIEGDLAHRRKRNDVLLRKVRALAKIEADKYEAVMEALGRETVVALAEAGPELQGKLLHSLGLQGFLVTDGKSPLHLFGMAAQMATLNAEGWWPSSGYPPPQSCCLTRSGGGGHTFLKLSIPKLFLTRERNCHIIQYLPLSSRVRSSFPTSFPQLNRYPWMETRRVDDEAAHRYQQIRCVLRIARLSFSLSLFLSFSLSLSSYLFVADCLDTLQRLVAVAPVPPIPFSGRFSGASVKAKTLHRCCPTQPLLQPLIETDFFSSVRCLSMERREVVIGTSDDGERAEAHGGENPRLAFRRGVVADGGEMEMEMEEEEEEREVAPVPIADMELHLARIRRAILLTCPVPPPPGLLFQQVRIPASEIERVAVICDHLDRVLYWATEECSTFADQPSQLAQVEAPEVIAFCFFSQRPKLVLAALRIALLLLRHPQTASELRRTTAAYEAYERSAGAGLLPALPPSEAHSSTPLFRTVTMLLQNFEGLPELAAAATDVLGEMASAEGAESLLSSGAIRGVLEAVVTHAHDRAVHLASARFFAAAARLERANPSVDTPLAVLFCHSPELLALVLQVWRLGWANSAIQEHCLEFVRCCSRHPENRQPLLDSQAILLALRALPELRRSEPAPLEMALEVVSCSISFLDAFQLRSVLLSLHGILKHRGEVEVLLRATALTYAILLFVTRGAAETEARAGSGISTDPPPATQDQAVTVRLGDGRVRRLTWSPLQRCPDAAADTVAFMHLLSFPQLLIHLADFYQRPHRSVISPETETETETKEEEEEEDDVVPEETQLSAVARRCVQELLRPLAHRIQQPITGVARRLAPFLNAWTHAVPM